MESRIKRKSVINLLKAAEDRRFVLNLCVLLKQDKTFHIFLDTIYFHCV